MPIQCPQCQSAIVIAGKPPREVICPSCGSNIQVDPNATAGWLPEEAPRRLGKFEFLEQLGIGSFGAVYKARDTELERMVAIKIPRAGNVPRPEDMDRFLREARSAAHLKHPGIVALYDAGQSEGTCYLVSEFVQGATLDERLSVRRFSFRQAAELLVEVADALHHAHQHDIVHRDLKPSNIMLDLEGRPHLMDFGLAKRAADEITLTLEGQVLGTPAYMAPEQARGAVLEVDARSDVYSLGVILYELLTGELPFRGQTRMLLAQVLQDEPRPPRRLNDKIPRDLETICLKAMSKSPGRRYSAACALADDLRRFLRGEPIQARPITPAERFGRWCRRNPSVAGLTAALILVVVVGFAGVFWKWHEAEVQKQHLAESHQETEKERNAAVTARDRLRRLLYAADVSVALQACARGDLRCARQLLDRQRPGEGQEDLRDFTWRYVWRLCQGDETASFDAGAGATSVVAAPYTSHHALLAPDGQTLVTVGRGRVVLWDVPRRLPLAELAVPTFRSATLAPDGQVVAVGCGDGLVRLWHLADKSLAVIEAKAPVEALAYCRDGKRLAVVTPKNVQLWDTVTRREMARTEHVGICCATFSPNGKLLATGDVDRKVRLWEADTARLLAELSGSGHTAYVMGVDFSPDGKLLASCGHDGAVILWDPISQRERDRLGGHRAPIRALAFAPSGKVLASGGLDGVIRLWDSTTRQQVGMLRSSSGFAGSLSFARDGTLASAAQDGSVKLWRTILDAQQTVFAHHDGWVNAAVFSPSGRRLVTTDTHAGRVTLWDVASGKGESSPRNASLIWHATISADDKLLVTSHTDGVCLWDLNSTISLAAPKRKFKAWVGIYGGFALSPDSQWLAARREDNSLDLWDLHKDQMIFNTTTVTKSSVASAVFSPDGKLLAIGERAGKVKLWDCATKAIIGTLSGHQGRITNVCFSPDGKLLATTGFDDRTVRLWDVDRRELRCLLGEHTGIMWPAAVAFSPDGKTLTTGGDNGVVKLWHTVIGQEVGTIKAHRGTVTSVAFAPDGNTLVSAGADGDVHFWRAAALSATEAPPSTRTATVASKPPLKLYQRNSARASLVLDNGVCRLDVHSTNRDRDVQGEREVHDLQEGETYRLRFRAKAERPRTIRLSAQIGQDDWHGIGLEEQVPLKTEWETYEYTFRATKITALNRLPNFGVGAEAGSVWIADVAHTRISKD